MNNTQELTMDTEKQLMLSKLDSLTKRLSPSTPVKLENEAFNLYAKLEFSMFMGNIKDRSALYIMRKAVEDGHVTKDTTVIESSSGNFALALAGICSMMGVNFIPVIDPNILPEKERLLRLMSYDVVKVSERDHSGGFLLTRLEEVQNQLNLHTNTFNPNQYQNDNNYMAYYNTLGVELCESFDRLDYLFVSVSTGGTVTGLSLRLKEKFKNLKVIAVDVEGSLVFSDKPKPRKISGMGAGFKTKFFDKALIDDFVILPEKEIIDSCNELLKEQSLFIGGSSGAAYRAAKNYLNQKGCDKDANVLFVCPDNGNTYLDTIYNKSWVNKFYQ